MNTGRKLLVFPISLLGFFCISCVEEFNARVENIENLLVVDALITDEFKQHHVELTRVFAFGNDEPLVESGALVRVLDDTGLANLFEEREPGVYSSQNAFAAEQGKSYQLHITTADGKDYRSTQVILPKAFPVGAMSAKPVSNENGDQGVGIFLDNSSNGADPTFFRYEFEETYKIIAPRWEAFRFQVVRNAPCFEDPFVVEIVTWEDERRTCFGTAKSQRLIQNTSVELEGSANTNFRLHFLAQDNYIISHRYSINVRQYAQTQDAYSFYERLGDFSSFPDIFSQVQPGFLEGNITQESNPDEMVLGYFEVASVSEERMYFNYEDVFPGEDLPPYPSNCGTLGNPRLWPPGYTCLGPGDCEKDCISSLIEQIMTEEVVYAATKEADTLSPYFTWPSPCGDCTKIGSNIVPEFWTEE